MKKQKPIQELLNENLIKENIKLLEELEEENTKLKPEELTIINKQKITKQELDGVFTYE